MIHISNVIHFQFFLFSQKTWNCTRLARPTGKQNISQSNCKKKYVTWKWITFLIVLKKKIKYTITEIIGQDRKSRQATCFKTKIPEEDTLEHASSYSFSVSTLIDSSIASSRAPSIVSRFSIVVSVSVIPSPFVSPIFTITYNIYNIWTCTSHWVEFFSEIAFLFQFSYILWIYLKNIRGIKIRMLLQKLFHHSADSFYCTGSARITLIWENRK